MDSSSLFYSGSTTTGTATADVTASDEDDDSFMGNGGLSKSAGATDDQCHVSSRDLGTGTLRWRRNVCSSSSSSSSPSSSSSVLPRIVTYFPTGSSSDKESSFYTLDDNGSFREWDGNSGEMIHEVSTPIVSSSVNDTFMTTQNLRILGAGPKAFPIMSVLDDTTIPTAEKNNKAGSGSSKYSDAIMIDNDNDNDNDE